MHYPKEDDGEHYTACLLIKGLRDIEPRILYPKEESGSHCLLILDLKPHSAGLKNGSTIAWGTYTLTRNYLTFNLTDVEIENADELLDFRTGETTQRHYMIRYLDTEGIMDMYCHQTGTKRFKNE